MARQPPAAAGKFLPSGIFIAREEYGLSLNKIFNYKSRRQFIINENKKIKSTAVYSGLKDDDDDNQWLLMEREAQGYAFSGTNLTQKDTRLSLYLSGMKRIPLIMLSCSRTLAILGAVNYSTREKEVLHVKTQRAQHRAP